MRFAIIDSTSRAVINVVDYDVAPSNPPPGFVDGIVAVQNDTVDTSWAWDGSNLVAPQPQVSPPKPASILSQDLVAQFTADDAAKIQASVSVNPQFWLLWSALQAQKDPMEVGNARFQAGWSALVAVLGVARMTAIATALGVTII